MTAPGDPLLLSPAAIPADIRASGAAAERRYEAALGFERTLTAELTKCLAGSALGEGESAATAAYRDMLPGTLADAVTAAGGIGLARTLYDGLGGAR